MRKRSPSASALALALCLASSGVSAQVSDFDRATARTLWQEGHQALDKKDFAAAADHFERAYALVHAPTALLGLAEAQAGLGKLVNALETYNRILREGLPPHPPSAFVKAVESARQEFDALAPRIPYVTIQVMGPGASGATVTVDDIAVPSAALGVKRAIDPGSHRIRADAPGFGPIEVTVTIAEGKTEAVVLEPKPRAAAAPPVAENPAPPREAPSDGKTRRVIAGVVGGVGVAGIVVGSVLGALARSARDEVSARCASASPRTGCLPSDQGLWQGAGRMADGSTASFIFGGAAVATGLVLWFTAPAAKQVGPSGWRFTPVVGRGGAAGVLEGSY